MRFGMLHQMVLHKLSEQPRSGYDICSAIERESGKRPSYGSIYPILEKLTAAGKVTVRQQGRRKVYSLTALGRKAAAELERQHSSFIDEEMVRIKKLMRLMEMDPGPMLAILERAKRGQPPLGPISRNMFAFRDTVFRMVQDGRADRHAKEINRMLAEMRKRLERMG